MFMFTTNCAMQYERVLPAGLSSSLSINFQYNSVLILFCQGGKKALALRTLL